MSVFWFVSFMSVLMSGVFGIMINVFCISGVFYECFLVYMFSECVDEWCVWCVFLVYVF